MRKLSLTAIGMYGCLLQAYAQEISDSSAYKEKKLTLEEVNFVSGYYHQNGVHSAVTGGEGTEKLTDFANTIDLKLSRYDRRLRKQSYTFELGIDHYSSASSDKIDPFTLSSASYSDTRIYPSANWSIQNEPKGTTFGLGASLSNEYDYQSFGANVSFTKSSLDHNREFTAKLQGYFDQWKVILPIELRDNGGGGLGLENDAREPRDSYSGSFSYAQVVNQRLQVLLVTEPTYQKGLLATRYQRVFFSNGGEKVENLPGTRFKVPVGARASYFAGDRFIIRSFYRYYQDDWGLKAHTAEVEVPVKFTSFVSVSPFYRYYSQNAVDYFAPIRQHKVSEEFFTSDYDLSKFNSNFYGAGLRLSPPKGVFGVGHWNSLELRYGHYHRNDGLNSNIVTLHARFK